MSDNNDIKVIETFYQRLKDPGLPIPLPLSYPRKLGPEFEKYRQKIWKNNFKTADFLKLNGQEWLNDTVIDRYFEMIVQRSKRKHHLPKVYAFNCFFYAHYQKNARSAVKEWIQEKLFNQGYILLPICHAGNHWTMAIADVEAKIIIGYDSMGIDRTQHLEVFRNIMVDRAKVEAETNTNINPDDPWEICMDKNAPLQANGHDCGVFMCQYAQYVCSLRKPAFRQLRMNYYRKRMRYELLVNKLLDD